jgi:hypothetical protein
MRSPAGLGLDHDAEASWSVPHMNGGGGFDGLAEDLPQRIPARLRYHAMFRYHAREDGQAVPGQHLDKAGDAAPERSLSLRMPVITPMRRCPRSSR